MIKGIGIDVVDISRIERLVQKYKNNFLKKVYTHSEIEYCKKMARPAIHYAGRWAAKEAFYKALPLSCQKSSTWKSIEIITDERGKPVITICSDTLQKLLKKEGITMCHVSISHEKKYCMACVILE